MFTRAQPLFSLVSRGDVFRQNEHSFAARELVRICADTHEHLLTVFASVGPNARHGNPVRYFQQMRAQFGNFTWRANLENRQLEKIYLEVSIVPKGRRIDREHSVVLTVIHPHRVGIIFEKPAIADLVLTQRFLRGDAFADVHVRPDETQRRTILIENGATGGGNPGVRAVASLHAVLDLIEIVFTAQMRVQLRDDAFAIVRVNARLPFIALVEQFFRAEPQHFFPTV